MALYPLQDVLGLGSEARLNLPGRPHGNWTWRYRQDRLQSSLAATLREMAIASGRWLEPGVELEEATPQELDYEEL
jgi:4-alpha-glucanotransferase